MRPGVSPARLVRGTIGLGLLSYPARPAGEKVAPEHDPAEAGDGVVLSKGRPQRSERHHVHAAVLRPMSLQHAGAAMANKGKGTYMRRSKTESMRKEKQEQQRKRNRNSKRRGTTEDQRKKEEKKLRRTEVVHLHSHEPAKFTALRQTAYCIYTPYTAQAFCTELTGDINTCTKKPS